MRKPNIYKKPILFWMEEIISSKNSNNIGKGLTTSANDA